MLELMWLWLTDFNRFVMVEYLYYVVLVPMLSTCIAYNEGVQADPSYYMITTTLAINGYARCLQLSGTSVTSRNKPLCFFDSSYI